MVNQDSLCQDKRLTQRGLLKKIEADYVSHRLRVREYSTENIKSLARSGDAENPRVLGNVILSEHQGAYVALKTLLDLLQRRHY